MKHAAFGNSNTKYTKTSARRRGKRIASKAYRRAEREGLRREFSSVKVGLGRWS